MEMAVSPETYISKSSLVFELKPKSRIKVAKPPYIIITLRAAAQEALGRLPSGDTGQ